MMVQQSLRTAVGKWLDPKEGHTVRVLAVQRGALGRIVSVCVEIDGIVGAQGRGPHALFFFRHADRIWRVFPPERARPAMRVDRLET
ncbi:hypothetical protein [Paraburkholderia bannensis]|uniref:hypothetical protein n=1 Tax=Paraburkholderia bannensis TaxID=765414 RepID=UPI002AB1D363|nr:hypothetical protein [Paraburkholderia bannensis]